MQPSEPDLYIELLIRQFQKPDHDIRDKTLEALLQVGIAAVVPLRWALREPDPYIRLGAANTLAQMGSAAVGPLCEAVEDSIWYARLAAVETLGKIGDGAAVAPLCRAIRERFLSPAAAEALWKIGAGRTLPRAVLITELLNGRERYEALQALQKMKHRAARGEHILCSAFGEVRPFCEGLVNDPEVQHGAREVLGYLDGDRLLRPSERDPSTESESLVRPVSRPSAEPDDTLLRPTAPPQEKTIAPPSGPDLEDLIRLLRNPDMDVRSHAAMALGKMGTAAVEMLCEALRDPTWYVRFHAADALGTIGDASAVEALGRTLRDPEWAVRSHTAMALGKIGEAAAARTLGSAIRDPVHDVRVHVIEALGKIGDAAAIIPLCNALRDRNQDIRTHAATALRMIGAGNPLPRAVFTTKQLNGQERYEALQYLLKTFKSQYKRLDFVLCGPPEDAQRYCEEMMFDPETRQGATEVLSCLKGKTLLRPSEQAPGAETARLVRPASGPGAAPEDTLLRSAAPLPETPTQPIKKRRWFRR